MVSAPNLACGAGSILDRRSHHRYTIPLELQYKLRHGGKLQGQGAGTVRDLSTGGVSFETDRPLPLGQRIELSINWPVMLDHVALNLTISGTVIRSDERLTAVQTGRYEFRTRAAHTLSPVRFDTRVKARGAAG